MNKTTICVSALAGLIIGLLLAVHIIKSFIDFTLKMLGAL
jgi:type III secretory pathway component EscS